MAINLATKYSKNLATVFAGSSYLGGRTSGRYEFTGVKGIKVYTPTTVELTDYTRSGPNRYGTPTEMQDTVQEMVMTQDKSFALTIDKGNNMEQLNTKAAGRMLKLQISERVVPMVNKHAFSVFVRDAGKVATISAKPAKTNIVEEVGRAHQHLDDNFVAQEGRYLFVTAEVYNLIRLSSEFVGLDGLGTKSVGKGEVGELFGSPVIKVPGSYLPENCFFILWHKSSVLDPNKIQDAKIHRDPPGLSGDLLEGRWLYDAFVLGARANGVYALVLASAKQAAPTITHSSNSLTIASSGADTIKYTTDGSDPRYSSTALVYSAAVSTASWSSGDHTVRAVAYGGAKFTSDVAQSSVTIS